MQANTHTHTHMPTHTGQDLGDGTLNATSLERDGWNLTASPATTSSRSTRAQGTTAPYSLAELAALPDSPAWARCSGCNHFLLMSRCGVESQFRWPEAFVYGRGGRQLNFLGTMQHFFDKKLWSNTQWFAIERIRMIPKKAPIRSAFPVFTAIPYPGTVHPVNKQHLARLLEYVNASDRPYELMLAVGYRPQRAHVIEQCVHTPGCVLRDCRKGECNTTGLLQAYTSARFCLQLRGDTHTRQGIFDSMALGCIPVLTDGGVLPEFHVHVSRPQDWSLVVGWRTPVNDSLRIIRSMSAGTYARMRQDLFRTIPSILWSHHFYTDADAYGLLLQHVQRTAVAAMNRSVAPA